MNDLHLHWSRARERLHSLPARATLLLVVACAAVGALALLAVRPAAVTFEPLYPGRTLSPREVDRIRTALGAASLAEYQLRDGVLHVPASQHSQYLNAVVEAGCVQSIYGPSIEATSGGSLLDSRAKQLDRMRLASEMEASLAIRAIRDVKDAFVYFSETTPSGFRDEKEVRASVGVWTNPGATLDAAAVSLIQDLLLGIKAELRPEQITIADLNAGRSYRGATLRHADSVGAQELEQRSLDQRWQEKLSSVLMFVPEARVAVRVQAAEGSDQRERVGVSVGVPASYFQRIRSARSSRDGASSGEPPITLRQIEEQVRQRIQAAMRPLLPGPPSESEMPGLVVVTPFDDLNSLDATARGKADEWKSARLSSTAIVLAILLTSCAAAILGLQIQRRREASRAAERTHLRIVPESTRGPEPAKASVDDTDESLRERLQSLVEEDPDAAARSLADWIDKAS